MSAPPPGSIGVHPTGIGDMASFCVLRALHEQATFGTLHEGGEGGLSAAPLSSFSLVKGDLSRELSMGVTTDSEGVNIQDHSGVYTHFVETDINVHMDILDEVGLLPINLSVDKP